MVHKSMAQGQNEENKYYLYNNTVELAFDEFKHMYTINGKPVNGTTSVLGIISKPALMYWAVNITIAHFERFLKPGQSYDEIELKNLLADAKTAHRKKSSDAQDIGTAVHDWIRDHVAGKKPKMPINVSMKNAINTFLRWEKEHKVKFLASEKLVYSKKHGYAGTLDFIAKVDGKIFIGDYKTSTAVYDEYWLQLAAYQQAYLEEYPEEKIAGGIIVRIGKDGTLEVAERKKDEKEYDEDYRKNAEAFNNALALYRRVNEMKAEKPFVPKWKN